MTVVWDNSVSASLGGHAILRAAVQGGATNSFQWRFNGANIPGATKSLMVITNAQPAQVGQYSVVVTGPAGSVTSFADPFVIDPSFIKITSGALVETSRTGRAGSWGDFNNDNNLDLFMPAFPSEGNSGEKNLVFINNGDETFTRASSAMVGAAVDTGSYQGIWGDIDNDGWLDLFVMHDTAAPVLYRNNGRSFSRLTAAEAGDILDRGGRGWSAEFADFNNDGNLDLYVLGFPPVQCSLFFNDGHGRFTQLTHSPVTTTTLGGAFNVACADYDDDGFTDILASARPQGQGSNGALVLFHNLGDGSFAAVTNVFAGLRGMPGGVWGDYDNDGAPDLFVPEANTDQKNSLFHNDGNGLFTSITNQPIVRDGGESWSAAWGDYDNDGFLDLFVANSPGGAGMINYLYHNEGDGTLRKVTTGSPVNDMGNGSGVDWVDYNNDGFLDLFVGKYDGKNACLYQGYPNGNNWLVVKLRGAKSNSLGVGAKVRVRAFYRGQDRWQLREIFGGCGRATSAPLYAHLGLGDASRAETVRIEWPSGIVQELSNVAPNQYLTVTEEGVGVLPRKEVALAGSNYTFRAACTLPGTLTYRWALDGVDVPGATSATLTIVNAQKVHTGQYSVTVSNGTDSLTSEPVFFSWPDPPLITSQPQSQIVLAGTDVTLSVDVAPSAVTPQFQWQRNGMDISGANRAWLVLSSVALHHGGEYAVVVSNPSGVVASSVARLHVVQDASIPASLGGTAKAKVTCTGAPPDPAYQWLFNGTNIAGATRSWLVISNAQPAEMGQYSVVVTVPAGAVTCPVAPLVNPAFTKVTAGRIVTDEETSVGFNWGDYDNDGYLDLYVANVWPFSQSDVITNSLYHNNGDGSFTKMLTNTTVARTGFSWSAVWGDYTNDGLLDLFVPYEDLRGALYVNLGQGAFASVTNSPVVAIPRTSLDGAWGDYDQDGFLDLFLACGYSGNGVSDPGLLYRNNGDGAFASIKPADIGLILDVNTFSFGCRWLDFNNDGELDFSLANGPRFRTPGKTRLFENLGRGLFRRVAAGSLAAEPSMAMAWGDYDNDGYLDAFAANSFAGGGESPRLHRNLGGITFTNVTETAGILLPVGAQSAAWGDYDNDGWPDLFVCQWMKPNVLYRNRGDGSFQQEDVGSPIHDGNQHFAAGWVDYNNDGWLDLFVSCGHGTNEPNLLYQRNPGTNGWLEVQLTGRKSNAAGIGAKVRALANIGGKYIWQMREIASAGAWSADQGLRAHFGLGDATNVDVLRIEWPSGITQVLTNIAPRQILTITEAGVGIRPRQQLALAGSNYTFQATGTLPGPVAYQWRYGATDLPGETNSTLTISNARQENTGPYSVVVSNGAQTLTSEPAVLYWPEPPAITSQPQSQIVLAGAKVTFSIAVAPSTVQPTFQWQHGFSIILGATNATLTVTNLTLTQAGGYSVVVSNPAGSVTSDAATLTVVQDASVSASLGGNATLRVLSSGPAPTEFQWRCNGADIPGATKARLTLTNVGLAHIGDYAVRVTSAAGSIISPAPAGVIDPTFTKITSGPLVTDLGCSGEAVWGDFDNDGYPDVFVSRLGAGLSLLYQNHHDGTFTSTTNLPSQNASDLWWPAVAADFDNDGNLDLFIQRLNKSGVFYFNEGGGVFVASPFDRANPYGVASADYDRDGLLDLFVSSDGRLYRNNGERTFSRTGSFGGGLYGGATWGDYDDDGWLELFCGSNGLNPRLYKNDGFGQFESVSNLVTKSSALNGAWGDYDNDGLLDFCGASYGGTTYVYRNLGKGEFEHAAIGAELQGNYNYTTWIDYDNDGFLDLFLIKPFVHVELYHNRGDGTFTPIQTGSIVTDLPSGTGGSLYSSAGMWFDYDNDGFLDLYVSNGNDANNAMTSNFLYRNNGNRNAWLKVKLVGTTSNRDGAGAKVRVQARYAEQVRWQRRDISVGDAYNGGHLYAHFGLGDATNVDVVRIEWPSGIVQELHNVAPRQFLTVTEPPLLTPLGPGEFQIRCWKGMQFQVETSTDLAHWTPLSTVTNLTGTLPFKDPRQPLSAKCFYRVVAP